jgi:hypothetical protein
MDPSSYKQFETVSDDQPCLYCTKCMWRHGDAALLDTLDLIIMAADLHLMVCR